LNSLRKAVIDRIWRGQDPFLQVPSNLIAFDLQGWNSQHPYLEEAIRARQPPIVVEIGVWKGGSTVFMADRMKALGHSAVVIAVDTWLGSSEHWLVEEFHAQMSFMNGYPALYHKFAANVLRAGVADHVVPLPLDSLNAAQLLRHMAIGPAMIHLDGGHDYDSVTADLKTWWPVLLPGGLLVGDDYFTNGQWPTVKAAFDDFFAPLGLGAIENQGGKCRIPKPAG
jgi:predicted O-methyltransferase YrrM